jgi:hypothetical protein
MRTGPVRANPIIKAPIPINDMLVLDAKRVVLLREEPALRAWIYTAKGKRAAKRATAMIVRMSQS